jgi:A/G-specific adenine glycosylase
MSFTEADFTELIWQKGGELYRSMPWRQDTRPYYVLVSELMLQQTQVDRVVPKFEAFIAKFPNEKALAEASLADVLKLWNGLGYNRRAKYLHDAARMIVTVFDSIFPADYENLVKLPGVGKNTAGAILAYAFSKPAVFIETNVRTVYFHHFFPSGDKVSDAQITELLERTLDKEYPREFYWALMDYGTWLKKQGAGQVAQSRHYVKQSALKGSVREVRGQIVRTLTVQDMTVGQLQEALEADARFGQALRGLIRDGLVQQNSTLLHLTK